VSICIYFVTFDLRLIKTYKADINIQMNFGANRRGNQEQEIQRQSTMDTVNNGHKAKQTKTKTKTNTSETETYNIEN
jgi:hypothetical protein